MNVRALWGAALLAATGAAVVGGTMMTGGWAQPAASAPDAAYSHTNSVVAEGAYAVGW